MGAPKTIKNPNNLESDSFQVIFQTSNEGIIVADAKGVIQLANPTSEKMFGYEGGELKNKNIDILVPMEHRSRHEVYRKIYEGDPQPRTMGMGRDLTGVRKDGSELPIEVSLSHTYIDGGFRVVAFIIDITKRKKVQEKLKKSEAQLITYATELEQRVKKRTVDLNATIKKLEETNIKMQNEIVEREKAEKSAILALQKERELNELKSRFVSTASHEFRTPLSSILSSANLIDKYLSIEKPEKAEKHIKKIKVSVKNLTDILNDFLSLGRLEEGKVGLDMMRTDLASFIPETISEIEGILKPNQKVNIALSHDRMDVMTDEKLLKHVVVNLISNASKYSGDDKNIDIEVELKEEDYQITIRDYGIGIPEDEQHHLFERFFRAKNATNFQGTGLGLNIVKKYVDLLSGDISYTSKLSEGTSFVVTIPVDQSHS